MKTALVIVDPQLDFMPGGSLAIPKGDEIVPFINKISPNYDIVVVTRDWHPQDHKSFTTNNGKEVLDTVEVNGEPMVVWPPHCVQDTNGAKFHPDLKLNRAILFSKGYENDQHPFSGFAGDLEGMLNLPSFLLSQGVTEVDIVGLAGDFCVKSTALDSHIYPWKTKVLMEGIRFLGDPTETLQEFEKNNIDIVF